MNGWLGIEAVMVACEAHNQASPVKATVRLTPQGILIRAALGDPRRTRRLEFSRLLPYHDLTRLPRPAEILDYEIRTARHAVEREALNKLEASNAA